MVMLSRTRREQIALSWVATGIFLFTSAFLWSPSRDGLDVMFVLGVLLPLLLVLPWQKPRFNPCGGFFTLTALIYAGFAVVATAWGASPQDWAGFAVQWLVLAFWLAGAAWLFSHRPPDMQRFFNGLVVIGLLVAISAMVNFYASHSLIERLVGWSVVRNPTIVGQVFGSLAILAYALSLQELRMRRSLLYFAATLVLALPLLLSQTRGAALALAIMVVVSWLVIRPAWRILAVQAMIALLLLLPVLLVLDLDRILEARSFSWSQRDRIWHDVWHLAWQTPWLGSGSVLDDHLTLAIGDYHHPHNAWLDIFYRNGLIGLALALAHLLLLWRYFGRDRTLVPLYLWFGFGCICLLTDSRVLFWELNAKWFLYWIPAGLIAAVLTAHRVRRGKPEPVATDNPHTL